MRRKRSIVFVVVAVILLGAAFYLRPAWESEASIRHQLLALTPPGTAMAEVRSLAEKNGWVKSDAPVQNYVAFGSGTGIEVKTFSGELRRDPFPYRTGVGVVWQFSQSNQLVDVSVVRHD